MICDDEHNGSLIRCPCGWATPGILEGSRRELFDSGVQWIAISDEPRVVDTSKLVTMPSVLLLAALAEVAPQMIAVEVVKIRSVWIRALYGTMTQHDLVRDDPQAH